MSSRAPFSSSSTLSRIASFRTMFLLLLALLSLFFFKSYVPGYVQFSNDGPFGRLSSACHHLPERFTGDWEDLNSIGFRGEGGVPNITFGLLYLLKPEGFAKFQALIALLTLGLSAWCFFKESGLAPAACLLGGVAAVLNSCFFSLFPFLFGLCIRLLFPRAKISWK